VSVLDYYRPKTKERLLRGEYVHWIHGRKTGAKYIERCVLSFPSWVDRAALQALWREARRLEEATGEPHHLDHIIPLSHPRVCGLSVPWNFQVSTKKRNESKGNAWCEWHGDLFTTPEQLKLF
jgi:hypothetical protein